MAQRRKRAAAPKIPKIHVPDTVLKLDLGCGQTPREGFQGVDLHAPGAAFKVDLWSGERWPWADNSVEEFNASHVIEHIEPGNRHKTYSGQGNLFFFFFEEAYRCLKPDGLFHLQWPHLKSVRAFMDPTHCRFIPRETMLYLDKNWRDMNKLEHYLSACDFVGVSATSTTTIERSKMPDMVQQQRGVHDWDWFFDEVATLRARKA